jgi:hypothetical protein
MALGFILMSCEDNVNVDGGVITIPGTRLDDKLAWLRTNAQSNTS